MANGQRLKAKNMKVCIIGLGLIGGSFALALRKHSLAGGGFESTVRLAKSSAEMWIPILMQNKYNVLDVLREYIHQLEIFRKVLEKDNRKEIRQTIERANTIRKILDKK